MKKKNIEEEMIKRFDEYFAEYYVIKNGLTKDHKKTIKSFIQSEIDSARQQERERIIEVADKLRDNTIQDYPRAYFQEGYNQAIDKIIKTLKN